MSTSFQMITKYDIIPTVRELLDGLNKLNQFESTSIHIDQIEVNITMDEGCRTMHFDFVAAYRGSMKKTR